MAFYNGEHSVPPQETQLNFPCSWLLMRYPMPKATRAKLVRLYYELCLVPGLEPRITRNWADMISRLVANKAGLRRKLEASDLELPWKPLWRALQKELWPKKRLHDSSYAFLVVVTFLVIDPFTIKVGM
jgi:proteasome activator subunit 4